MKRNIGEVANFSYNGFCVDIKRGKAKFEVTEFLGWTSDPGIARFMCNDNKERLIPSCCITTEMYRSLPPEPTDRKLNAMGGKGDLIGRACSSN